ncbi:Cytochrome P450 2U1 [Hypsibius exemplaris]|uniref:Cytochrome P450 2U1 n=1 Tax=Hypsibius exemplaris TaxID=2072580 RepID=A0A1W0WQK7_HYPEX|nr:Cytochrome P450 2U1 [Hypsibius exemplaris]
MTKLLGEIVAVIKLDFLVANLPILMWFPNTARNGILKSRENMKAMVAFFRDKIREHNQASLEVDDYLHAYQQEEKTGAKTDMPKIFCEPQLLASLYDLFAAGTDTTSTSLLFGLILMVEYPEVMRKVQAEIDTAVGRGTVLTNSDRVRLPYTEATILEIQRYSNILPLGVPHKASEDLYVDGFTIPKGALIVSNIQSIHHDPRYWKNPEIFDPLRFLDNNKKLIKPDGFIPFGIGKRACLGEALAKMELFLFFANFLRCFTLESPPGMVISHKNYTSSIIKAPMPFELIFSPRC